MKKWVITLTALLVVSLTAVACGSKDSSNTLKVGASAVPHAEILNFVKPILEKEGVKLEIKEFTDYVQPNVQVFEKQLDANFFQHKPYLDNMNKERNMDLVPVVGVHLEPIAAYSKKIKSADEIQDGFTIAIPNDASNGGRALLLLEKQGLIKLKEGKATDATVRDIVENPKNLKIKELEAAMLPRILDEVDVAIINTNFALQADLSPSKDSLFIEDKDSPYANILVSRPDNKDSDAMKKLAAALNSPEVKKFIADKYGEAVLPAF
ncbi:methionine ABC transporter substrate-binding protein [Paenibacillus selenitireducens]|uniref:Lipoprotein n=1 Tax=Paenibacillus selenitireducens TaxID=1324314 RepID=A0A1T2XJN3_9BACL|nr:MetQ/NlpA family ABC transporter substrate-binding protein [Paenibacillus selenitireducens]OPA80015.1 methionine ABC transporter substrate-binding protein [Paenibacillus selenitireducens]